MPWERREVLRYHPACGHEEQEGTRNPLRRMVTEVVRGVGSSAPAIATAGIFHEWFPFSVSLSPASNMERVLGIGGVFFKARDPKALAAWYREHLGVPVEEGQTYGALASSAGGEQTVWSTFAADTTYFGSGPAPFMVNYRVRDLDAMLAQLRAAGAMVEERVEEYDNGRFGWAVDPEGNR